VSTASAADRRIRSLRGPKPTVDPWKAHGSIIDRERRRNGTTERALTIFLAGGECPFTCSFCDLWRYTIDGPTPHGALPRQIEDTLQSLNGETLQRVKLYNASNFFDRRTVPVDDLPRIAELCSSFGGVTVESHATTVGAPTLEFAGLLSGRLEVAVGLETIHSQASAQLNKRLTLAQFERAASFLRANDLDLRVFVLLGAPGIPADETVDWTVRSVEYAAQCGASLVSIVPVRGGNGEMERLARLGQFRPPTLSQLESALDRSLGLNGTVVTADLWDVDRLDGCSICRESRVARLERVNLTGKPEGPIDCDTCGQ
jgi:radical SAM enzyme (TIGR01210 family)